MLHVVFRHQEASNLDGWIFASFHRIALAVDFENCTTGMLLLLEPMMPGEKKAGLLPDSSLAFPLDRTRQDRDYPAMDVAMELVAAALS